MQSFACFCSLNLFEIKLNNVNRSSSCPKSAGGGAKTYVCPPLSKVGRQFPLISPPMNIDEKVSGCIQ